MTAQTAEPRMPDGAAPAVAHFLHFDSLYQPGRGIAVPCDDAGRVDLDRLTERQRNVYLAARAMVGREYLYPKVRSGR